MSKYINVDIEFLNDERIINKLNYFLKSKNYIVCECVNLNYNKYDNFLYIFHPEFLLKKIKNIENFWEERSKKIFNNPELYLEKLGIIFWSPYWINVYFKFGQNFKLQHSKISEPPFVYTNEVSVTFYNIEIDLLIKKLQTDSFQKAIKNQGKNCKIGLNELNNLISKIKKFEVFNTKEEAEFRFYKENVRLSFVCPLVDLM